VVGPVVVLSVVFIREVKKHIRNGEKQYDYVQHRLIESIRTPNGPRQRVLLNLGKLDIPKDKFKSLANLIEAQISNHPQMSMLEEEHDPQLIALANHFSEILLRKQIRTAVQDDNNGAKESTPSADDDKETTKTFETVDVNSTGTSQGKTIGAEHVALTQLREIGFFRLLKRCGWNKRRQNLAAAQICARLVHPASERETARWLRQSCALDELLGEDFSTISDHALHDTADALLKIKGTLESGLAQTTRDLFSLKETLVLYDLTNTYFESAKTTSAIARFGRSKEKRNDCPLVTLALVVDGQGFPKHSKIYAGNISEPGTLWEILEELMEGKTTSQAKTVVIDAGIATEENLRKLREDARFEYVAISRKRKFEEGLFEKAVAETVELSNEKTLTVKMATVGSEKFLLCESPDRLAKDQAIFNQRKQRFETRLKALRDGLKKPRTRKGYASICERIGRLKERYKIGSFYKIEVDQEAGQATAIRFRFNATTARKPGRYLIRTSRKDLKENELSSVHRTLTMIEMAFHWLKMDLGLQPNFHQRDKRIMSHITISVLAYYVLAPILNKLDCGGRFTGYRTVLNPEPRQEWEIPYGWHSVVNMLATQTRVTTSFQCKDGRRLDIRTTMEPTEEQRQLYGRLKMKQRPLGRVIFKHGTSRDQQGQPENVVPKKPT
jgi:transposase